MLKADIGAWFLFSHYLKANEEFDKEDLECFIEEHDIETFAQLEKKLQDDLSERFMEGYIDGNGNTGDGEFYPGNEGHCDQADVDLEWDPILKAELEQYFESLKDQKTN